MNILFLTENELRQDLGGTDRISITLAKAFADMGQKCFLAFCRNVENAEDCLFEKKILLGSLDEGSSIFSFLNDNNIDIILSNLVGIKAKEKYLPLFYEFSRKTHSRMVVCYHAMPGEDILGNRIGSCIWRVFHGESLSRSFRDFILQITPYNVKRRLLRNHLISKYRLLYDNSDCLVMHTETAGRIFAHLADVQYDSKFAVMPNALSYNDFINVDSIPEKEKEVLLISRMDDKSKNISFALNAWKKICKDPKFCDWKFTIAGGGQDLEYFRHLSKWKKLKNISILGRVDNVVPLYERSSIFLMTSSYEGWGLTLTESQQFGCVPVVLYSFPSLPAVVTDKINGLIVDNNNMEAFVASVTWLMEHDDERESMAFNAVNDSKRWEINLIAGRWLELFNSLIASL